MSSPFACVFHSRTFSGDNTYMNINVIGERLRRFREEAKLSQEDLSGTSGVPQGTISRLENAVHGTVEIDTIQALAAALGMTSSELMGEKEPVADPKIREVNALMQSMPEYKKNAIVGTAQALAKEDREAI
jgi:transcriptional regulator with XRE-family HTH domain